MAEHDYDAAARNIKIEDITSDDTNRSILRKLKENDTEFDKLYMRGIHSDYRDWRSPHDNNVYSPEGDDDSGWLGYYIGKNKQLRELQLVANPFQGFSNNDIESFYKGAKINRSIRRILFTRMNLSGGEIFQSLRPFFKNNHNLSSLR